MAEFRRGFKTECERLSLEVRGELGLFADDRLDPEALADHLAIPVVSLEAFQSERPHDVARLTVDDAGCFSAATVFCGTRRLIVYNPAHAAGRHANSLAHELAHVLLEHQPGPVTDETGRRVWADDDEAQADWLGGTLLVPREGILPVMYRLKNIQLAARHFGVSRQLMQWRFDHTGAAAQM